MPNQKFNIPKLKGLMAAKGYTYDDLAKLLGRTRASVHAKLVGNRKFTIDELSIISEHFGISRDDLFSESE